MEFAVKFAKQVNPNISQESIDLILSNVQVKSYKRGDIILKAGSTDKYYYYVKKGIVRGYIESKKGGLHVKGFYTSNQLFSPLGSILQNIENKDNFDCLEDAELLLFDFENFKESTKDNPDIAQNYIRSLELAIVFRENRINDLITLDATERYLKLKKDFPNIENLVAQYHIASYLNITPVQLSRIRKKIYSK